MITVDLAERVHALLLAEFGGASGLRDLGGLEDCLARPFQTFGDQVQWGSPRLIPELNPRAQLNLIPNSSIILKSSMQRIPIASQT